MQNPGHQGQRKLGKWMLLITWLSLIFLLTLLFNSILEEQNNPNRTLVTEPTRDGRPQVVLERNRSGHYIAPGRINGTPVSFILDTGATRVAVPEQLADRIGLEKEAGGISRTANGDVMVWSSTLEHVELGGLVQRDVKATILPGMQGEEVLLGMSFLKHLEMVQRDGRLYLRP